MGAAIHKACVKSEAVRFMHGVRSGLVVFFVVLDGFRERFALICSTLMVFLYNGIAW